ncbi:integral membrane protein [Seiridium cupressi]
MMTPNPPVESVRQEPPALPPSAQPISLQDVEANGVTNAFCSNFPGQDHVILVRGRRGWALTEGWRLENNPIMGVGLLEPANAGDFAANIWNDVPVPLHAVILMAIGGTVAGVLCTFAFADSIRAWHNMQFLRRQAAELQAQKKDAQPRQPGRETIDKLTKRELRTEIVNRWSMDILMGVGSVLISIGTFMAIGGADHTVFFVSNILSGYLGNAPIALFGLINASWQAVVWKKMHSHKKAAEKSLQGQPALTAIRKRCFNVQLYSIVNGTSTVLGGVGSMLTPTWWWGYVILLPVIIASFLCNLWWRRKVGYDRPDINSASITSPENLMDELRVARRIKQIIEDHPGAALCHLVPDREKPDGLLTFSASHGLFESFCQKFAGDESLCPLPDRSKAAQLSLDRDSLSELFYCHQSRFLKIAEGLLHAEGPKHFRHRRRFFTEFLGEHTAGTM